MKSKIREKMYENDIRKHAGYTKAGKRGEEGEVIARVFHSRLQRHITDLRDYLCDLTMAVT